MPKPKPKPPQTHRRFVIVSKAICEMTITATTAKAAIAEWKRRQKRRPRLRGSDCVIQLLADPPACLDVESGKVTQHVEKSGARHKWAAGVTSGGSEDVPGRIGQVVAATVTGTCI